MSHWTLGRMFATIALAILLWVVLAIPCLFVGSTPVFEDGRINWGTLYFRLFDRVLIASLVGAALAASGVIYQAILRNPLADPYLLGVSSGAALFAFIWQFTFLTQFLFWAGGGAMLGQQVFAFAGALLTVAIVFALATQRGRLEPITLLLVGVIVNAVNGSIFLLINALVKDEARPGGPLAFLVGSLQTHLATWQIGTAGGIVAIGWVMMMASAGKLNVAMLGTGEAQALGVRIHWLRWSSLVVASLVVASAVAISGPIGFVGLVCPHIGRMLVGNDQRKLLPVATALGAGLLALADAATRLLSRPDLIGEVLPVGVLTGLLGGPFFLLVLWQNRRKLTG